MTNAPVLFKYNKTSSQGLLIFLLWFFSFVVLSLQPFNIFWMEKTINLVSEHK